MPKIAALGSLSSRGFGEFAQQTAANYIEDVFSTYLYTGTGSAQTITNGIDLSTKGGLVWIKGRSGATDNVLYDTVRGVQKQLVSNATSAQSTESTGLLSFLANGFSIGNSSELNTVSSTYASWSFNKQSKFFDIVTYTGNGNSSQTISHNLGSVPGMIIAKGTSALTDWPVYHRSLNNGVNPEQYYLRLNATSAQSSGVPNWGNTAPTATQFTVGSNNNINGYTYVAYLFAHDAGGFGADGSQNVISCGSFTSNNTVQSITLGYEPQFVIVKSSNYANDWWIFDNMRGMSQTSDQYLVANTTAAEATFSTLIRPTATGFTWDGPYAGDNGTSYIYMAIRRGPMRTPTSGTSVFSPNATNGTTTITTNFPVDALFSAYRPGDLDNIPVWDRLRGGSQFLSTSSTDVETTNATYGTTFDSNTTTLEKWWGSTLATANWSFRRAPGFFDVVCYTGTGSTTTIAHNLGVVPELMITKRRNNTSNWGVYSASLGATKGLSLNTTAAAFSSILMWNDTAPTSSVFTVRSAGETNASGSTYVAYLFASCPGVSKVGSYTGTGATQTISCGFTGGARYVMIKRTDSTGDWWVWDTARGMVAGTDPRLPYNSNAAETNANWVYTTTGGFQIVTSDATVNASGGTYIYLAIA